MATQERSKGSIKTRFKDMLHYLDFLMIMKHDMHTGFSRDKQNQIVPADYITQLKIIIEDTVIARCALGPGISRDPFLHLTLPHYPEGTAVSIVYEDIQGNQQRYDTTVEYYQDVKKTNQAKESG